MSPHVTVFIVGDTVKVCVDGEYTTVLGAEDGKPYYEVRRGKRVAKCYFDGVVKDTILAACHAGIIRKSGEFICELISEDEEL